MVTDKEEDEGNEGSKKTKQVTNHKKAPAVLDQYLPDHIKTQYHVLEHVKYLTTRVIYCSYGPVIRHLKFLCALDILLFSV